MELVCLGTYSNYQQEASESILNGFIGVWLNLVTSAVLCPCTKHSYIPYNWFDSDDLELGVSLILSLQ